MAWRKSPQSLIDLFDDVVPDQPGPERRKMFGYPAALVNGNMCMGLHQEDFIVCLSLLDGDQISEAHRAAALEPTKGRAMPEYVSLPAGILDDEDQLADWIARSVTFVSALPAKQKEPCKTPAKK